MHAHSQKARDPSPSRSRRRGGRSQRAAGQSHVTKRARRSRDRRCIQWAVVALATSSPVRPRRRRRSTSVTMSRWSVRLLDTLMECTPLDEAVLRTLHRCLLDLTLHPTSTSTDPQSTLDVAVLATSSARGRAASRRTARTHVDALALARSGNEYDRSRGHQRSTRLSR